jgi:hypothetical protein
MTRALLYSQGKSTDSFMDFCKYYLEVPSEEFVKGKRKTGAQSNISLKNIVRWNLTKTVIETSPSRGLVHFHGLLQVTYMYFQSPLINTEKPPDMILSYETFISYMKLFTPKAYVNFQSVKKYLDEQDQEDFLDRWEKYIKKGMDSSAADGTAFVGIANRAVKKKKAGRNRTQYQYRRNDQ